VYSTSMALRHLTLLTCLAPVAAGCVNANYSAAYKAAGDRDAQAGKHAEAASNYNAAQVQASGPERDVLLAVVDRERGLYIRERVSAATTQCLRSTTRDCVGHFMASRPKMRKLAQQLLALRPAFPTLGWRFLGAPRIALLDPK
jgi:hypothetical protein